MHCMTSQTVLDADGLLLSGVILFTRNPFAAPSPKIQCLLLLLLPDLLIANAPKEHQAVAKDKIRFINKQ